MIVRREYVCVRCGLVWFDEKLGLSQGVICPECNNDGNSDVLEERIFAFDTLTWFYTCIEAKDSLKSRNKRIHYHKNHEWYEAN